MSDKVVIEIVKVYRYNEAEGKLFPTEADYEEKIVLVLPNGDEICIPAKYYKGMINDWR